MILKYLWERLHRPFIGVVFWGALFSIWFWLINESPIMGFGVLILVIILGCLYVYWDDIVNDYAQFKGGQ